MFHQLREQSTPLLPEEVGSCQATVSSNDTQVGDATLHQVVGSLQTTLMGAKLFAAGAANNGPTLTTTSEKTLSLFF